MTSIAEPTPAPSSGRLPLRTTLRLLAPTLLVHVVAPCVVYLALTRAGMSEVVALAWSAAPSAVSQLWEVWRTRRINGTGLIVLGSIAIGIVMALLGGDPHLAVARDAIPNLVIAAVFAGSLVVCRRPIVYHLVCVLGGPYVAGLRERMDERWADPRFRLVLRRATGIGAAVLVGEAVLRYVLAQVLPVAVAMPLLQVQSFVVWIALVVLLRRSVVRALRPVDGHAA